MSVGEIVLKYSSRCIPVIVVFAGLAMVTAGCSDLRMAANNERRGQSAGERTGYGTRSGGYTTDVYTELKGSLQRAPRQQTAAPARSGPAGQPATSAGGGGQAGVNGQQVAASGPAVVAATRRPSARGSDAHGLRHLQRRTHDRRLDLAVWTPKSLSGRPQPLDGTDDIRTDRECLHGFGWRSNAWRPCGACQDCTQAGKLASSLPPCPSLHCRANISVCCWVLSAWPSSAARCRQRGSRYRRSIRSRSRPCAPRSPGCARWRY